MWSEAEIMTEVYVYTRMPQNGKLAVHHGMLSKGNDKAYFHNLHDPGHWMTSLSNNEGEVRGHSVWFTKPNKQLAIKALNAKDKERSEKLLEQAQKMLSGITL